MNKPWYAPRTPNEIIPVPWLHPAAIEYLEKLLCPEWSVLEHGAGGSTLWLAERVHRVVSIEHTEQWRAKVRELAPGNVTLLGTIPDPQKYDLFIIDGEREKRGECILAVPDYVLSGGWVLLDNANRPEYAVERKTLFSHSTLMERFDNNIPGSNFFITEFWKCRALE